MSMADRSEWYPGQIVSVRSDPSVRGVVVEVLPGAVESRVTVFVGQDIRTYYASQLRTDRQPTDTVQDLSIDRFHAYLTALQLRNPSLSTLYSLNAARVDFIPHQFRPVLRFIRSDRPRLLIADSVGVGKTIEAGLILRELQARRDINAVLIICPRPLVTECKWQREMKRFDERFTHLDGKTLRYCMSEMDLEGIWPEQHQKVILPYSLLDEVLLYGARNRKGLLDLDPPPRFDLVIVDEAHHVRNQNTYAHQAVRFFCDHAEAAVFLTATPIQLGSHDLFVLLNILRPDLIRDQESFRHMAEPNPLINYAVNQVRSQRPDWEIEATKALDDAAATDWGQAVLRHNPEFIYVKKEIANGNVSPEERVRLIGAIESLHTFSGFLNRTRRRDIGAFTVRKPETVIIDFTPDQRRLHDELVRLQADIFSSIHSTASVAFMMTTIRRQAASCLYGLAPFLEDILHRHLDELEWEEADTYGSVPGDGDIDTIRSRVGQVLEHARSLDRRDPKLERLRTIIQEKQALENNKAMLFSSFRHTLHYIYEQLVVDGVRVGMIHGGTPDDERVELRCRFEKPRNDDDSLDLMLFSEVGCEGLDYQFCDCIVNYDLPWNPMRVEQRIGRIDRNGQLSDSVAIVNLITPGTVDADIYERCLVRIGVFESAIGGSEEILGKINREINSIAENYLLSGEDRRERLQQLADNEIRLMQEHDRLEQQQVELFGVHLPEDQMRREIDDASSFWLTPCSVERLVTYYLKDRCGKEQEFILGEEALKMLRLGQSGRNELLRDLRQIPKQTGTSYREWETWLRGGEPHLPITFEAGCAAQHLEATFVTPLHPLAKQAAMAADTRKPARTALRVRTDKVPAGRYRFAVYQWRLKGIKQDLVLMPVGSSDALTPLLGRLLESAVDADEQRQLSGGARDMLDEEHYRRWAEARADHRCRTGESVSHLRQSLSTSHRARMALLAEQLAQTDETRIHRMRQSQIVAATADYERRIEQLDAVLAEADIIVEPVAYGHLDVVGYPAHGK